MKRPEFTEIFTEMALKLSKRSTCQRLQVGCVVTSTDYRKVLSMGYNANAAGLDNKCDRNEKGNCGCIHAEQNAIINCDSPRYVDKIFFITHFPCPMCMKFIINVGNVKKIYYLDEYRNKDAQELAKQSGIEIIKL